MISMLESINPMSFDSGPGIRVEVILSNGQGLEVTPKDIVDRIRKFRPYIGPDGGGVTFKGQYNIEFLKETCKLCHKAGINTCIETSGREYTGDLEIFKYIDLIILNIESIPLYNYSNISTDELMNVDKFITNSKNYEIDVWIKQLIKKDINDNIKYIEYLNRYLRMYDNIKNVEIISEDIDLNVLEELKNKFKEYWY